MRLSRPDPASPLGLRFDSIVIARKRVYHLRVEPFDAELYDACGNALLLVQLSKPLAFNDGSCEASCVGLDC